MSVCVEWGEGEWVRGRFSGKREKRETREKCCRNLRFVKQKNLVNTKL